MPETCPKNVENPEKDGDRQEKRLWKASDGDRMRLWKSAEQERGDPKISKVSTGDFPESFPLWKEENRDRNRAMEIFFSFATQRGKTGTFPVVFPRFSGWFSGSKKRKIRRIKPSVVEKIAGKAVFHILHTPYYYDYYSI